MTVTINREFATTVREVVEDTVEYLVTEYCQEGNLISGETVYKMVAAVAEAKLAEMEGLIDSDV